MASNWIPVRDQLPETEEWVVVQTQDGTVYPAEFKKNVWVPLFRGGLVEQLMHGKVAYWMPHEVGFPYVQCKCGSFFLQAEGRKECPVCVAFGLTAEKPKEKTVKPKKEKVEEKKEEPQEEIPFADVPNVEEDLIF